MHGHPSLGRHVASEQLRGKREERWSSGERREVKAHVSMPHQPTGKVLDLLGLALRPEHRLRI